jgi:hypothetical protein
VTDVEVAVAADPVVEDPEAGGAAPDQAPLETYEDDAIHLHPFDPDDLPGPSARRGAPQPGWTAFNRLHDLAMRPGVQISVQGPADVVQEIGELLPVVRVDAEPIQVQEASWIEEGSAWAARADDLDESLIYGILPAKGLAVIASAPKTGKTWLAYSMIVSICSGRPLLGQYHVSRKGRVLLLASEGSHAAAIRRLRTLALGSGVDPEDLLSDLFVAWRKGRLLDDPKTLELLRLYAPKCELIVVDVLRDQWAGEENDATASGKLASGLKAIAELGPTIVLIHHMNKPTADSPNRRLGHRLRGSSALHGAVDAALYLEDTDDGRVKVSVETRDERAEAPFTFRLPDHQLDGSEPYDLAWQAAAGTRTATEALWEEIRASVEESPGTSRRELIERVGHKAEAVHQAVRHLVASGKLSERDTQATRRDGRTYRRQGLFARPDPQGLMLPETGEAPGKR